MNYKIFLKEISNNDKIILLFQIITGKSFFSKFSNIKIKNFFIYFFLIQIFINLIFNVFLF